MRDRAEDRHPQLARHLLRIPYSGIRAVEDDRAQNAEPEAGEQSHQKEAWGRVLKGTLRDDRRVENPDIRNRGLGGEPGLIEALLELCIRLLLQLDVAIQTSFFNRSGRDPAQIARRRVHLSAEFG